VICYTGSPIVNIGSTLVWLLSLAIAIAASLKDKSVTGDNLLIAIINTVVWATVMFNVGYPCWPPFAFVMLGWFFIVELMYDP